MNLSFARKQPDQTQLAVAKLREEIVAKESKTFLDVYQLQNRETRRKIAKELKRGVSPMQIVGQFGYNLLPTDPT